MGTTRIKVIDLSSDEKEIKTSGKRAEKIARAPKAAKESKGTDKSKVEESSAEQITTSVPSASSAPSEPSPRKSPKPAKPTAKESTHHMGMNYLKATKSIDKNQNYSPKDAIDLLYKTSFVKFDSSVELHINVTDKNVKANVNFPHAVAGKVKEKKFLVFSEKPSTINDQRLIWADDKTLGDIESGKLKPKKDFDVVIASPKFMPQLAKVAKILGPAGMMPNPKNGTITDNVTKVIEGTKDVEGTEFRTDPTAPILHTKIGKLSFKPNQIEENLNALIFAIGPAKIQKAILKSTMSPAIKLDITSIQK